MPLKHPDGDIEKAGGVQVWHSWEGGRQAVKMEEAVT